MNRRRWIILLAVLLCALWLAGSAMAMSSPAYRLDWHTNLTGGGGGPASSTNYAINLTLGQTAIQASSSTSYQAGLGYWYGIFFEWLSYLPMTFR